MLTCHRSGGVWVLRAFGCGVGFGESGQLGPPLTGVGSDRLWVMSKGLVATGLLGESGLPDGESDDK
jgi:hypothetical protein